MPVRNRLAEMHPEITAWRRDLHENPELMYDLPRTSKIVADKLTAFGCDEVVPGIGISGVVGVIHGRKTGSGKVLAFRADLDALPIHEASGVDYASKTPGKMHACGHDGHTAILLGAAQYLAETRNFDGTVVLAFQPAEEGGAGGKAMVDDGLMDRWGVQEVYGLHNMPGFEVGQFAIREGALLASADEFEITVTGKGGHAAMPHETVDTTLVASHIVVALQSIVARNIDPLGNVVVTVGAFHTDSVASNVIAHEVVMKGTVRTLDPDLRNLAQERIEALVPLTAQAYGGTAVVDYQRGYPVTVNHPEQTAFAADCAEEVAGSVIRDVKPVMPAEDFAFMLEARPGAYIFMGNGDTPMCHHPAYEFDDNAIPAGCSWFVTLAERRMPLTA
ncbi:M20 aminoacylase family protein [Pararhodobacter oceanensis]|uniref:Amidohydrolase n=1 Tax=Pararhodobacter oceanensis TaxID=2172121 RepID=A0A2T8HXY7_9RHOB|nr:M20 aminoacylase family protein [Pararhodobacter oceanensis]PVH30296.1 amidohydrolase [Pararhodobacter oceanensis]